MPPCCRRLLTEMYGLTSMNLDDTPQGSTNDSLPSYRDLFGRIKVESGEVMLLLQRVPSDKRSIWKISNATVAKIPELYSQLGYGPIVEWFVETIPEGRLFKINLWEWALLLTYLLAAFVIVIPITWLIKLVLLKSSLNLKVELGYIASGPLRFFLLWCLIELGLLKAVSLLLLWRLLIPDFYC